MRHSNCRPSVSTLVDHVLIRGFMRNIYSALSVEYSTFQSLLCRSEKRKWKRECTLKGNFYGFVLEWCFFFVLSVGWWDMADLEASEMHRTVNVSHGQMGTDLLTLSVFSASSSYLKLENRKSAIFLFHLWICSRSVKLNHEWVYSCNVSNHTKYNTSSALIF